VPSVRARAVQGHEGAVQGHEGDRYIHPSGGAGRKALTLVEDEVVADIGLEPREARRRLTVRSVRLNDLVGKRFISRLCLREPRAVKLLRRKQLAKLLRQDLQVQTAAKFDDFARLRNGDDAPRAPS
jgi:hypothetical protein